jgi:hypothetical protein
MVILALNVATIASSDGAIGPQSSERPSQKDPIGSI